MTLLTAYSQYAHEERRPQPPALRWIGWPWLVCGTVTVLMLCWLTNCVVEDLGFRERMLERVEEMTQLGGWHE